MRRIAGGEEFFGNPPRRATTRLARGVGAAPPNLGKARAADGMRSFEGRGRGNRPLPEQGSVAAPARGRYPADGMVPCGIKLETPS
jgi:hypothetical protein